jgi:hypothetical protein
MDFFEHKTVVGRESPNISAQEDLEKQLDHLSECGWACQGGVSAMNSVHLPGAAILYQLMVRKIEEPEEDPF